jgi:L-amino acid N-acyltransferase YncA
MLRCDHATPPAHANGDDAEPLQWIGINALGRPSDQPLPFALSEYGEMLRARGDGGLLGVSPDGRLIGWIWVRTGPYSERAGCGYLEIPEGARVVRDFKVLTELRGAGIGGRILSELGCRLPAAPPLATIAFASPDNAASVRAFERAGFSRAAMVETRRIASVRLTTSLPQL